MKKFIKVFIFAMLISVSLVACQQEQKNEGPIEDLAEQYQERIDGPVNIDEATKFLQMDDASKQAAYQALDEIVIHQTSNKPATDYSQIKKLETEEDYINFLVETNQEAKVLYFGFDECPFCQAFIPKLNHLALELDLPIYYYNTREHEADPTFANVLDTFKFETVPQAYIVKDGKPVKQVNHNSSMKVIEEFLLSVGEMD